MALFVKVFCVLFLFVLCLLILYHFMGFGKDDVDWYHKEKRYKLSWNGTSKVFCTISKKFLEGITMPKIRFEIIEIDWKFASSDWFFHEYYSIGGGVHTLTIDRVEKRYPLGFLRSLWLSEKRFLEKIEVNIVEGKDCELTYVWKQWYRFSFKK